jgi:hypothetical protein
MKVYSNHLGQTQKFKEDREDVYDTAQSSHPLTCKTNETMKRSNTWFVQIDV